jgi:hypothetical protein
VKPLEKIVLVSSVALLGGGCVNSTVKVLNLATATRNAIYAQSENFFANAVLLKPRAEGTETNLAFALAPLLLLETPTSNSVAAPAVVGFQAGQISLAGKTHPQMSYWWAAAGGRRGIRLTLDARGLLVIWEALNDRSGADVIFVSQSLETGAAQAFGGVLPSRRFAVETELAAAPNVVVARVLADGPAVMGPLVHLAATGDVTTLICRCMAAQTRTLAGEGNYELRPLPPGSPCEPARLDLWLRLPPDF